MRGMKVEVGVGVEWRFVFAAMGFGDVEVGVKRMGGVGVTQTGVLYRLTMD